jgi:membrane-associated phospholipid phosphatase
MLSYEEQLVGIEKLQTFFLPVKPFFVALNHLDKPFFYTALVTCVWLLSNQKRGFRLFFLLMISGFINLLTKNFYDVPRPMTVDPSLGWTSVLGLSTPSGAAQAWMIITLFTLKEASKKWLKLLTVTLFIFVSLSRVVIGAHYFTDVGLGFFYGFILFKLYEKLFLPNQSLFYPVDERKKFVRALTIFCLVPIFFFNPQTLNIAFLALGVLSANYFFPLKVIDHLPFFKKVLTLVIALAVFLIEGFVFSNLPKDLVMMDLIKPFIYGFSIFFIAYLNDRQNR